MVCGHVQTFSFTNRVKEIFPIITWLPKYNHVKLKYDLIAGLTLGMMLLPSAIAFSNLSGLPPEYGLYTALTPGIVYALFGTSKDISVGPSVNMAMFVGRYIPSHNPLQASMLTFILGVVLLLLAILKLDKISNFIPRHVMDGFITGVVWKFLLTQLSIIFGYPAKGGTIIDNIVGFVKNVKYSNIWDISTSIFCIVYLGIFLIIAEKGFCKPKNDDTACNRIVKNIVWFLCILRSSMVCIIAATIVFILTKYDYDHEITLSGKLPRGFPEVQFPFQSVDITPNKTITVLQSIQSFGSAVIVLPVIQLIQAVAIGKTFGKINNYKIRVSQEMIGVGMANVVNSFFGGWFVCGGLGRSAVNSATKAKTPLSGAFSCIIVMLGVSVITPAFEFIPKASLSAMLLMAVLKMFDIREPYKIWKINRIDVIPYMLSFAGTLYSLEFGIVSGSIASLVILSSRQLSPMFTVEIFGDKHVKISFQETPNYPCTEDLKEKLFTELPTGIASVEISMSNIKVLDLPTILIMRQISDELSLKDIEVIFVDFENENIEKSFINSDIKKLHCVDLPEKEEIDEYESRFEKSDEKNDVDDDASKLFLSA